ncbi:programmed cell death protein 2 [Mrakia frigida]|uniref:small subunit rRNA maturation protein TSR4 n=1 Tax=Mrakia frigida TaxID=29902 RepID=UPI003FCC22CA
MADTHDDDDADSSWSSDSSASSSSSSSSLATTTLLGLPDGVITVASDVSDPQVSRLGGPPSFLPTLNTSPPISSTSCPSCSSPMELLVQLYAPLEGSVDDRVVYVWGCARAGCQGEGRKGSIRAFSSIKRNDKFATVKERKAAKKAARQAAAATPAPAAVLSSNPFSTSSPTSASNPFNPFAASSTDSSPNPFATASNPFVPTSAFSSEPAPQPQVDALGSKVADISLVAESSKEVVEEDEEDDEESEKLDPAWSTVPSYPPVYLSTQTEYIPKPRLSKAQKAAQAASLAATSPGAAESGLAALAGKKPVDWDTEGYVKGSGIPGADELFERFLDRLSSEPEQVIRYDFGSSPLPYSSTSKLHSLLFPPKTGSQPIPSSTRSSATPSAPAPAPPRRGPYDPTKVPSCPRCKGERVFEMQLTPVLLNLLKVEQIADSSSSESKEKSAGEVDAEEARRRELERVLGKKKAGGESEKERTGMEWGSVCVFSCLVGCGGEWGEEWVGTEWED